MGSYFNVPRRYRRSGPPPTIRDFLFDVENVQYDSPTVQILGWGYSERPHTPVNPEVPEIPTWMSPAYPFVNPPDDIRGFIVDALLSFDNPLENIEAPIKLARITKHSSRTYSVRFTDVNDNVVFDSSAYSYNADSINLDGDTYIEKATNQSGSCVYKHKEWGTYYELLYWETELVTLKMIIRKTTIDQFVLYPDMAELDARALYQYPKRVRSITIENDNEWKVHDLFAPYLIPGTHGVITGGHIQIWEGYNMKFDWSDNSDIRTSHIITLSATKGAGKGVAKLDCPEEERSVLLTSINNKPGTDDGNFYIKGDSCHTVKGLNQIDIGNDCKPCCECEDMTKLGRLLKQIEDEYYCTGGKCRKVADILIQEIQALNERIAVEENGFPIVDYLTADGNRLFLRFRFIFHNCTKDCISNLSVKIQANDMAIFKGTKSTPTSKDHFECTVIDEDKNFVTEGVDYAISTGEEVPGTELTYHTITWSGKIAPEQQVYIKGLWQLDTTKTSYTNFLEEVSFYDTKKKKTVKGISEEDYTGQKTALENELNKATPGTTAYAAAAQALEEFLSGNFSLGSAGQNYSFTFSGTLDRAFKDFTSEDYIDDDNFKDLEKDIRSICMKEMQPNWREDATSEVPLDYLETRNWDAGVNDGEGGKISDSDLIDKHSFDPKPDYYRQRPSNSNN